MAESSGANATPPSPVASRAAAGRETSTSATPNASTAKPLRSGLRPPSKLKSNKYDHRNHTKNCAGMMAAVDTGSSDSDEDGDHSRARQKPRRRKPKSKTREAKNGGSAGIAKGPHSSGGGQGERSQRSTEGSPRGRYTSKHDDNKDGSVDMKIKGRPRHPGRQATPKFENPSGESDHPKV